MKKQIFITFLFLCPFFGWAESVYEQIKPSVNAEMFKLPAAAENSLNEGQLSFSIQLPSLPGKGYDLPISLTFYAGNISHLSDASPIGLGWSLNAGGSLCMIINDKPDSAIKQEDVPWQFREDYIEEHYGPSASSPRDLISKMYRDRMPDSFSYNLPGHSGEIVERIGYSAEDRIDRLMPDIEYVIKKHSDGYSILDDQGNEFIFEGKDKEFSNFGDTSQDYVTAWFLSKIKTCQGGTFIFEYELEEFVDYMNQMEGVDFFGSKRTRRITKITSDYGCVTFDGFERSDRKPLLNSNNKSKQINKITFYSLRNGQQELIQSYDLQQDIVIAESPSTYYTIPHEKESEQWLSLTGIQINGKDGKPIMPPYEFEYDYYLWNNKKNISSNCWATPRWRILQAPNLELSGKPSVYKAFQGAYSWVMGGCVALEDSIDGTTDEYFVMKRITYPTQREEVFLYEKHKADNVNHKGNVFFDLIMGKRLKAKVTDGKDTIKYEYYNGSINNIPIRHAVKYVLGCCTGNYGSQGEMYYANPIKNQFSRPHNSFIGQPIHYERVKEIFKEGNRVKKTMEYFYSPSIVTYPVNFVYTIDNGMYHLLRINNDIGRAEDLHWPAEFFGTDNIIGLFAYPLASFEEGPKPELLRLNCYDEKSRLVKTIRNVYDDRFTIYAPARYGYKIVGPNQSSQNNLREDYYISRSCHCPKEMLLKHSTTVEYIYDGNNVSDSIVEKVTNVSRTRNRIFESTSTKFGQTTTSKKYYIDKIIEKEKAEHYPQSSLLYQMWKKNLVGMPLQEEISRNGITQSATFNVYGVSSYNTSTNPYFPNWQSIVRLDSVLTYEHQHPGQIKKPTIDNETISRDSSLKWAKDLLYAKADAYLPEYIGQRGAPNTIVAWDEPQRLTMAIVRNYPGPCLDSNIAAAIRSLEGFSEITEDNMKDVKQAHLLVISKLPANYANTESISYTYNNEGKVTSISSSMGEMFFYFYDNAGRLIRILDKEFNPVESYKYSFRKF